MASPSPALVEFGRRLRERRTVLGMTLEELHERSGVHYVHLSHVERGLRNPTLLSVLKVAEALEIDPSELVAGLRP